MSSAPPGFRHRFTSANTGSSARNHGSAPTVKKIKSNWRRILRGQFQQVARLKRTRRADSLRRFACLCNQVSAISKPYPRAVPSCISERSSRPLLQQTAPRSFRENPCSPARAQCPVQKRQMLAQKTRGVIVAPSRASCDGTHPPRPAYLIEYSPCRFLSPSERAFLTKAGF